MGLANLLPSNLLTTQAPSSELTRSPPHHGWRPFLLPNFDFLSIAIIITLALNLPQQGKHMRIQTCLGVACLLSFTEPTATLAFSAIDAHQCVMQNLEEAERSNRPLQAIINERVNKISLASAATWRAWRKKWAELDETERRQALTAVEDWLTSTDTLENIDEGSVVVSPRVVAKTGYFEVSGYFTTKGKRETFVLFIAESNRGCEVIELEWQNARLSQGIASDLPSQ